MIGEKSLQASSKLPSKNMKNFGLPEKIVAVLVATTLLLTIPNVPVVSRIPVGVVIMIAFVPIGVWHIKRHVALRQLLVLLFLAVPLGLALASWNATYRGIAVEQDVAFAQRVC